jgi:hypothetical protein
VLHFGAGALGCNRAHSHIPQVIAPRFSFLRKELTKNRQQLDVPVTSGRNENGIVRSTV